MAVVAFVNQKGGVGKTTVALGLAAVAARQGRSVVVVDLDPQANATSGMGIWGATATVSRALAADADGSMRDVIAPAGAGWGPDDFDVAPRLAPGAPDLAHIESQMALDPIGAQDRLRRSLVGVNADLVIVDCPPSLGLLTVNGLFAADHAVIVTEPSAWAVDGVEQILRNISRIAERRAGVPSVAGIVVNRLARTRDARYWDGQLAEAHPDLVVRPAIASKAAIAEASAQSLPITGVTRAGAAEAVAQFDLVLDRLLAAASAPAMGAMIDPSPQGAADAVV